MKEQSQPPSNGTFHDSSPDSVSKAKELLKAKFQQLYVQLVHGCGREFCLNKFCASSPYSTPYSNDAAARKTLELIQSKEAVEICSKPTSQPRPLDREFISRAANEFPHAEEKAPMTKAQEEILGQIQQAVGHKTALAISFRKSPSEKIKADFLRVTPDFDSEALDALARLCKQNVVFGQRVAKFALAFCGREWTGTLEGSSELESALNIRRFLIILEIPGIYDATPPFIKVLDKAVGLRKDTVGKLLEWIMGYDKDHFQRLVSNLCGILSEFIKKHQKDEESISKICNVIDMFYLSNKTKRRIHYKEFYNETANTDYDYKKLQIKKWYRNKINGTNLFTVFNYAWMLNPESKYMMLSIENDMQQDEEAQALAQPNNLLDLLLHGGDAISPFCQIEVNRETLIEDSLNILSQPGRNFRKELKVKFKGEEGVDSGGVRKEFFQLIVKQIFDPAYGMFNYNEETRTYWFNPETFDAPIKFELIGFILGLALYNLVILDVHLPKVVYRKLLGQKPSLEDLADYSPSIAQSMDFMLKYEDDNLEDMLTCTFSVETESYGKKTTVELMPGGSSIYVGQRNKREYVDLYIDWLFGKSVERLFSSFKKGFYKLYSGELMINCDPEELQLLICGSPILDFHELEKGTQYDGGYKRNSPTIINFWNVLHELELEQKKRFLFFTTGSDRAPVGGLGNMRFYIMKHGEDGEQLPTAHTCFNHLLLPPYKSKEKLREKLLIAITNSEGFGLL